MNKNLYTERMKWFCNARFGMFIHWGIYAIPARGEWLQSIEKIPSEIYDKYFDEFNPDRFNPREWARIARKAGMKYAVLTAKHHDGFCLFDSKFTDFKSTNTKFGRDIVREYLDAFRAEGLKVGLYYSLLDWHHPDFPHYEDEFHPCRGNENYRNYKYIFDNYLNYMYNQVEELCTNYGNIDILWFDFSYGEMRGEKWGASRLMKMVRKHQPNVIVDNRLEVSGEGFGSIATDNPTPYSGDFVSPEQLIPPKGIKAENGDPIIWEACITMNNNWGYHRYDKDFKSAKLLIHKLVECVSKGGNLLVNVGPDARGAIPEESIKILEEVGEWMDKNGDSIYGCTISELEKPEYGRITQKGNNYYFHVTEGLVGPIPIYGIPKDSIKSIRLLSSGAELLESSGFVANNYPDYVFVNYGYEPFFTYPLPDERDTVIKITTKA